MNAKERLNEYVSIVPNLNQKRIQRERFNVFFHYGINTFTSRNGETERRILRFLTRPSKTLTNGSRR